MFATYDFLRGKDSTGRERRLGTGQDIGADLGMMGSNMAQSDRDRAQQASQASSLLRGANIHDDAFALPESRRGLSGNLGHTAAERAELFGLATMKPPEVKPLRWRKRAGGGMEPIVEAGAGGTWVADKEKARAIGQWMESDAGKTALLGMMSTDPTRSARAAEENEERLIELKSGAHGELKGAEKDEFTARMMARDAQSVGRLMEDEKMTLEEASAVVSERSGGKMTADMVKAAFKGFTGGLGAMAAGESRKMAVALRTEGRANIDSLRNQGLITTDAEGNVSLTGDVRKGLAGFGKDSTGKVDLGKHAESLLNAMVESEQLKSKLSNAPGDEKFNQGLMVRAMDASASAAGIRDNLSVSRKREMAAKMRESGIGLEAARTLEREASVEDRFRKASSKTDRYTGAKAGAGMGAAALMGVEMSDEERRNLSRADPKDQALTLLEKRGIDVKGAEGGKMLRELTAAISGDELDEDGEGTGSWLTKGQQARKIAGVLAQVDKQAKENQGKEKEKDNKAFADAVGTAVGVKMAEIFGKPIRVIDESKGGGGTGNPVKTPGQ